MKILYNIIIKLLFRISPLFYPFLPKLRQRNKSIKQSHKIHSIPKEENTVWFHASSMGEFEQIKPIIELLREKVDEITIVCTFFSPSGYETQKNYEFADYIYYLPNDTRKKAKKFINTINPTIAVFDRYELWFNYLDLLKRQNIATLLINATFPTSANGILKSFYKRMLNCFTEIYPVNQIEYSKFYALNSSTPLIHSNDTRNDRILAKVSEASKTPIINRALFPENNIVLVCGSVWNEDIDMLKKALSQIPNHNYSIVFVPHEPTNEYITYIEEKFPNSLCLSKYESDSRITTHIIVDSIGKLLKLYSSADIAFIGGGFGKNGVHSVTEPAGYGIPLACGNNCANSSDAAQLEQYNALKVLNYEEDLVLWLQEMQNSKTRQQMGKNAAEYVKSKTGASKQISKRILLLLTLIESNQ